MTKKIRLIYLLHSGNLYGTERMALVTLEGLRDEFEPVLFAPSGIVHEEAQRLGIETHEFKGALDLFKQLPHALRNIEQIAVCATGVSHSLIVIVWNLWFRLKNQHLHLVHGGTDEHLSYGRKKLLNYFPVRLVAVSNYVKQRLLAHGVKTENIDVLENFLPDAQIANVAKRPAFENNGVHHILIISRIDPIKRIDVLFDALDNQAALNQLSIRILGTGWDFEPLKQRAERDYPNVTFVGFSNQVEQELTQADLLLHLCPTEPFGLAILEAMAANVPVLLPNAGGAASLIDEQSGWYFQANDGQDLARQLLYLQTVPKEELNQKAANAHQRLIEHYSSQAGLENYRQLFKQGLS